MSNQPRPKRPPLTHFLCLPLVNDISLPQLESSLAAFKASIPPSPAKADLTEVQRRYQQQRPLIPDDAIRPVGTLHLTLGVMSLPTSQRLDEALRFFHSLDLAALLRKAEASAAQKKRLNATSTWETNSTQTTNDAGGAFGTTPTEELPQDGSTPSEPFTISLESLHALPRVRSATILHAVPVDPTSRLYPFCEMLRKEFVEAGFLQKDYKRESKTTRQPREQPPEQQQDQPPASPPQQPPTTEPELRPLLLHATVVNTIYIRGRQRNLGGRGKGDRGSPYTFDARDILSHYRNFYLDDDRTVPRSSGTVARDESSARSNDENRHGPESPLEEENALARAELGSEEKRQGYPFVWARDFRIDSLCICKMGAKKLDPEGNTSGMNARLGEKYPVVAERSLDFREID
ncbi:uncharacterized protein BJX67DRAFT_375003 [Aspergillus lucknowensis]|uniref:AKAP7 2'5' RNA ligase-like domain-containing protein n=1 Tax=Aspergillus lucknowensis TaxID=176173 RepID=A0ABR4LHM8_9EURO